jgi:hypothetical protein
VDEQLVAERDGGDERDLDRLAPPALVGTEREIPLEIERYDAQRNRGVAAGYAAISRIAVRSVPCPELWLRGDHIRPG